MSDDGLDPDLAALFDNTKDAEEMEINGVAASSVATSPEAPESPARRGPPRRRGRGPDKKPRVMGRPAPTPAAGDAPHAATAAEPSPHSVPPSTEFDGSRDAITVWPKVLELCKLEGFQPEQIAIRVKRIPVGPVDLKARNAQSADLVPLTGDQVCGNDYQSAAEALYYTIASDYHLTYSGPAIYQLTFQYRFGKSGNIGGVPANCELKLDHPDVLKRQLLAKEHSDAVKAGGSPIGGGYVPRPHYAPVSQQSAVSGHAAAAPAMSQREIDLMRALERENGQWQGRFQAMQNAPPPAVAVPAAAQ